MGKRENKDIDRKWLIGCSAHYRLEKWLGANTQGKTPVFDGALPSPLYLQVSLSWPSPGNETWNLNQWVFFPDLQDPQNSAQTTLKDWILGGSLHQCLCVYFFALGYVSRRWYPASSLPSSPLESDRSGLKFLSGHLYAWPTGSYLSGTKPRDDDSTLQRGLRWKINWDKEPKIIRVGIC